MNNVEKKVSRNIYVSLLESSKEFEVYWDNSRQRLDCVLKQNGKVIAYVSR